MKDVMIDLETLGTKPGCVILSIGAVPFDPYQQHLFQNEFKIDINIFDSLMQGLKIDQNTVEFWQKQDIKARDAFVVCGDYLYYTLNKFTEWFNANELEKVWCQGATFDVPILQAAYEALGLQVPWKFWNVRDTRTAYDICDFDPRSVTRTGIYHNALDDARHQVKCVQVALA